MLRSPDESQARGSERRMSADPKSYPMPTLQRLVAMFRQAMAELGKQ